MKELKGVHVLAITVGFFGIIIAVNSLMAFKAISTFPGLEVENSYDASQSFDSDMKKQIALGWTLKPVYDQTRKEIELAFTDAKGQTVQPADLKVLVARTTEENDDSYPKFLAKAGVYVAEADLKPGKWMLHVEAHAADGTLFHQHIDFYVKG